MEVCLDAYRAAIGLVNCRMLCKSKSCISSPKLVTDCLICIVFISCLIILLCGDVEVNTGPRSLHLSIGHINERSLNMDDKLDEISSMFRLDRQDGRRGEGVALYISYFWGQDLLS